MEIQRLTRETFCQWIPGMMALYRQCFAGEIDETYLRWRYLDNPVTRDLFVAIAVADGQVVSFNALMPLALRQGDKRLNAAVSLNTMTHPDYQGQGLLIRTSQVVYDQMEALGYAACLSFPNYLSNPTFVEKLGFQGIYEWPTLTLDVSGVTMPPGDVLPRDDQFTAEYCPNGGVFAQRWQVEKTKAYLQWRYSQNPTADYFTYVVKRQGQVASYVVFKHYQDMINIVDLQLERQEDAKPLLESVIIYAKTQGKARLSIWAPNNSDLHLLLERIGFRNQYPIHYFGCKLFQDGLQDCYDHRQWYVALGDCTVY